MRKEVQKVIKQYMRNELLQTRSEMKITQIEMAKKLNISDRAYTNIESGKTGCGIFTFLTYMQDLCPDDKKFMEGLKAVLDSHERDTM